MDQYPRLRVTAAQLVLFAHVMISTTAVKHHKYSLASNVQSDGVNGKWTANVCNDCVTSSMSEAQKNEKKMKSGNCLHKNQTKVLVAHKECPDPECMVWECLYLNCDQFKFDPNKPNVKCTNCSMEPTIRHDCGCKKWKCEKRRCVGEKYNAIEECPDECSVPVTKEECGCTTYSCKYDKPPPSECKTGPGCNECEKCVRRPYRGPACTKTGLEVEVCEKHCEPLKMCDSECEVSGPVATEDQCGCPIQNCVPIDRTCSSDDDCGECEECVVADFSSDVCAKRLGHHMSKESKKCKRKVCPKAKDAMCDEDKCEYESVRVDKCGCEVRDCTGNPSHQCNSDDDCNDECKNKECKSVVVCEFGGTEVSANKCQVKDVSVPPCNKTCEKLIAVPGECGVDNYICESICRPVVEAECTGKCERPVTENVGECDCPTSVCRVPKDPPKPEEEPVCQQDCVGCHSCQWIPSEECRIWEAACLRTPCPSVWSSGQPPLNQETCYEKIQKDECLCEMEPAKKPCNKLPTDQCPPGTERCPANTHDVCGCPQHLCCQLSPPTTPLPPTPCESEKCNSCQSVLKYGPIKSGGCQDSICEHKLCPATEEITCEPCQEIKPVEDECGCYKYTCKPVECTKDNPCQSDQHTDTFRDQCNCERIHCTTTPVPTTPAPCPCGEMCEEQQCIKCD